MRLMRLREGHKGARWSERPAREARNGTRRTKSLCMPGKGEDADGEASPSRCPALRRSSADRRKRSRLVSARRQGSRAGKKRDGTRLAVASLHEQRKGDLAHAIGQHVAALAPDQSPHAATRPAQKEPAERVRRASEADEVAQEKVPGDLRRRCEGSGRPAEPIERVSAAETVRRTSARAS